MCVGGWMFWGTGEACERIRLKRGANGVQWKMKAIGGTV